MLAEMDLTWLISSYKLPYHIVNTSSLALLDKKASAYRVQVLDRAFSILDVLSENGPELKVSEISERLQLHKSTVHRLLMVLERHRCVEKNSLSGKYRLGWKLLELGTKTVARLDLAQRTRPYLERLVRETGETAHLGILSQGEMISVVNLESPRTLRTPSTVGRRSPAHCTSYGKSILAFLPEGEVEEIIRTHGLKPQTRKTITESALLKRELQRIREQGYAVDNEEFEEGLKCIGAPVRDHSGKVMAALSIAGPAARMVEDRMPALIRSVVAAASQLSSELGYRGNSRGLEAL